MVTASPTWAVGGGMTVTTWANSAAQYAEYARVGAMAVATMVGYVERGQVDRELRGWP